MRDKYTKKIVELPILALRGIVVLPNMSAHFEVGRPKSINAIAIAMTVDKQICLVTQKDIRKDEPDENDLYDTCVIANIKQQLNLSGENVRILVEGLYRGKIRKFKNGANYLSATVEIIMPDDKASPALSVDALMREAVNAFEEYANVVTKISPDVFMNVMTIGQPGKLADYITANIMLPTPIKQSILDELDNLKRLKLVIKALNRESIILRMEKSIHHQVQDSIEKNQKELYLREQLKVIYSELGEGENSPQEAEEYTKKILALNLPKPSEEKLLKEVVRMAKMGQIASEANVIRSYLDTCLELPWNKYTKDKIVIDKIREKLDKDHYGLKKVKERLIEYLAVKKLNPDLNGQIICLVGPPGVGKTSIAISAAAAIGRKFARISLGGIHDEAEIRGHRKTYIGSMPGRIINAFKIAGSSNPLILLDEIDKMSNDYKGDPASAMLEVLDGEQNHSFRDNYLEIPFDISKAIFVTTANTVDSIPAPLLDRMEIIELNSYTDEEKFQICKNYLLPKEIKQHGLTKRDLTIEDEAIYQVIRAYTRESGVRKLDRAVKQICRKAAIKKVEKGAKSVVKTDNLEDFLGAPKYIKDKLPKDPQIGVATGLAWTSVGGETLQIEVSALEGTGKVQMTGSLGDVMKESVNAAISYIRNNYDKYGIDKEFYKNIDLHIHFPEGAIPKDGPSAGITIATAIISELSKIPVNTELAMTGELTLKGNVLPIGGLNEKLCAAARLNIKTVIIPIDNKADLQDVDTNILSKLNVIFVSTIDEVTRIALLKNNLKESVEKEVKNHNFANVITAELNQAKIEQ